MAQTGTGKKKKFTVRNQQPAEGFVRPAHDFINTLLHGSPNYGPPYTFSSPQT
jgi:hypothetical protein